MYLADVIQLLFIGVVVFLFLCYGLSKDNSNKEIQ